MPSTCEKCCKYFELNSNYKRHLKRKKSCIKEPIKCKYCKKTFAKKQNLNKHIQQSCKKKESIKQNTKPMKMIARIDTNMYLSDEEILKICNKGHLSIVTLA